MIFFSELNTQADVEKGIEVPYKMTVIHSRPQESPLFLKFSFSVKCKVFVWATVLWSGSASASCQGTGAKCEQGREGSDQKRQRWPWSSPRGFAVHLTGGVGKIAYCCLPAEKQTSMSSIWEWVQGGEEVGIVGGGGEGGYIFKYPELFPMSRLEKRVMV